MAGQSDYKVIYVSTPDELERTLNDLGGSGWEPILYSMSVFGSAAAHCVILRRRPA